MFHCDEIYEYQIQAVNGCSKYCDVSDPWAYEQWAGQEIHLKIRETALFLRRTTDKSFGFYFLTLQTLKTST